MKSKIIMLFAMAATSSLCLAQPTHIPGTPEGNGLVPKTPTIDINTNFNHNSAESLGIAIANNGNVAIGIEDDDGDIEDFESYWTLYDNSGSLLTPAVTITNASDVVVGSLTGLTNITYRSYFRSDGSPTPHYTGFGPKMHANLFGDGFGHGSSTDAIGLEVPELLDFNLDDSASGSASIPTVQTLDNSGNPTGLGPLKGLLSGASDANAQPAGRIRIGDWEYLSNGNVVIVGSSQQVEDRAWTGQAGNDVIVYRIVTPAGVEVHAYTNVSSSSANGSIWHGCGATANGFAVRFDAGGTQVRMFDNAGNPTTENISLATLTGNAAAGGGGRGDGTGFHGNGTDAYVHICSGAGGPWVTVLNANGTLRWSHSVTNGGQVINSDRLDAAIAPDGRVIAVWGDSQDWQTNSSSHRLVVAKMFGPSGDPIGDQFFVSERGTSDTGLFVDQNPRVAWRGNQIAVTWESVNSPISANKYAAFRIFTVQTSTNVQANCLTPRTATIDINTNFNHNSAESLGIAIANNGNVAIGIEDDDGGIEDFESYWTLYNNNGSLLTPAMTITNASDVVVGSLTGLTNITYRSYFRSDGSPTPHYTGFGPKMHANLFGDGFGHGSSTDAIGLEVPELLDFNLDDSASGSASIPTVQTLDNSGNPTGLGPLKGLLSGASDADAQPAGRIRIGDWEYLSNGNVVIVGSSQQVEDRAWTGQAGNDVVVYRIVTPAGVEVHAYTNVSSSSANGSIWHGCGATANGFAVRFDAGGTQVRMFDNAGNPTTENISLATLTGNAAAGGGGRGDGTGFHGNGTDAYVHICSGAGGPWVTVLNANGTLRWSRSVADQFETIASDRLDAAIAPDGRVIAVFDDNQDWQGTSSSHRLVQARVFDANGIPQGGRFFLSERGNATTGLFTDQHPRVAWRGTQVAVTWESQNSPISANKYAAMRLFDVTCPITLSIRKSAGNITITWAGGGKLDSASDVTGPWSEIGGAISPYVTAITGDKRFFRVRIPQY